MKPVNEIKLPYPKNIRKWIWNNTNIQTFTYYSTIRYVAQLEMFRGKPLKRIFAFNASKEHHDIDDIRIKEIARYYDGKQYLGTIDCYMGGKKVYWKEPDEFVEYKGRWSWWLGWNMFDADQFLEKNGFTHTGWEEYKKFAYLELYEYLNIYMKYPKIELLAKAGLGKWISYIRYLDTTKKSLPEIFKIVPDAVELLKRNDFNYHELMACRKLKTADMNKIKREVEIREEIRDRNRKLEYLTRFSSKELKAIMKDRRTYSYLKENFINHYDYVNYLHELERIGAITDRSRVYPEQFHVEHERLIMERLRIEEETKRKEEEKRIKGIRKNYEKHKKFAYHDENYLIYPVSEPAQLREESTKLLHCVRSYVDNVAAGTTEIMLIRTAKRPDEPFYTLELKGKRVIQVRGKRNKNPSRDVNRFVDSWAKKFKLTWDHKQEAFMNY